MFLKKMLRDIRASKAQFVSIFILALLGVFVYSGMRAQWEGMEKESNAFYAETNIADAFVIGDGFNESTRDEVLLKRYVTDAQLRLELDTVADVKGSPTLRLLISDENELSQPIVTEGIAYDSSIKGIWLDERFARKHALSVGDKIALSYAMMAFELPIQGLILHPEFVHNVRDHTQIVPDAGLFGYACVPTSAINWPIDVPYSHVLAKVDASADIDEIKKDLEAMPGVFHVMLQKDHASVSIFDAEISQSRALSTLFPVIFFFVAALSMLSTMTRLVLSQRTLIGTFMSLGFSRRKILFHYISYGLWIGLAGGLLGLATGPWFISWLLNSFQSIFYSLPVWQPAFSAYSVLSVIAAAGVCVLSSYFACARELREMPAQALRPKAPKVSKHTPLEKTRFWHRLSFVYKWNIRDIMRSRVRSLMAVAGVAGCTMMLIWGIGIYDSMNLSKTWYFDDLQRFEKKVFVEPGFQLEPMIENADFQAVDERAVNIITSENREVYGLRVFEKGSQIRFEDPDGNELSLPKKGALVSYKTAQKLALEVGDHVTFRLLGTDEELTIEITSIHRTPFEQGLVMSRAAFEHLGLTMTPTAYLFGEGIEIDPDAQGVIEIQDKAFLEKSFSNMLEGINIIVVVLFLAAVLLGCVVLYNLGSLSFAERIRELATLRVLGYPLPKIRKLLRRQTIILTSLGILIGIPCGFFFVNLLTQTMSDSIDFPSYVAPASLFACVLGTFLVSVCVDLFLSAKTKHIDMVRALKSIE